MYYGIPDHPDIESAMRTGYPSWMSYSDPDDGPDPDFLYDLRREEAMFDD